MERAEVGCAGRREGTPAKAQWGPQSHCCPRWAFWAKGCSGLDCSWPLPASHHPETGNKSYSSWWPTWGTQKSMCSSTRREWLPHIFESFLLKMGLFFPKALVSKRISFRYQERTIHLEYSPSQIIYGFSQARDNQWGNLLWGDRGL